MKMIEKIFFKYETIIITTKEKKTSATSRSDIWRNSCKWAWGCGGSKGEKSCLPSNTPPPKLQAQRLQVLEVRVGEHHFEGSIRHRGTERTKDGEKGVTKGLCDCQVPTFYIEVVKY